MTEPLITVSDLRVHFGTSEAVRGISLHIDKGEVVAVVGESGSGKSVSALSILQLLPYPQASHPSGSIKINGQEIIGASKAELRSLRGGTVSMIFQEPMTSLNPLHTVGKQIGETLRVHRHMSRTQARARSLELLNQVRLPDPESKLGAYPHELSGGQRQRVMIAMALANEPSLLVADEPTTALDVTIQANILNLLRDLNKELGMAVLLISHDLAIVQNMADRVYVMTKGLVVEEGTTAEVFGDPKHEYTQHLIASRPKGTPPPVKPDAPIVLETDKLAVNYTVGKGWFGRTTKFRAVKDVSLAVRAGETVGVVGESGSGKTSLGLGILRLIKSEGPIIYFGNRIDDIPNKKLKLLRKDLQIVFQDPYGSLSPRLSLREIISEGLQLHEPDLTPEQLDNRVREALAEVDLDPEWLNRYPHEFSGGQRQRISLARAQILRPHFIILDEPTSALDMSVQAQIVELLRELQQKHNLAYLFISHDLAVVKALSHTIIVMKDGHVVESGPAADVFNHPESDYTRELLAAAMLEN